MNPYERSIQGMLFESSILGMARSCVVNTLVYPLEVIKTLQQSQLQDRAYQIDLSSLRREGIRYFYRGLTPQIMKSTIKQAWCWPLITGIPHYMSYYTHNAYFQLMITGIAISTVDALVTTPLERAKMLAIVRNARPLRIQSLLSDGWYGISSHWMKLTINWTTFLIAQKYFREKMLEKSEGEPLSTRKLIDCGVRVAMVVSLVSAPFDFANTLKQTRKIELTRDWTKYRLRHFYRGWPLSATMLIVHNIASVLLIDQLERRYTNGS